jgi:arsenate reductase (thioredoxin)
MNPADPGSSPLMPALEAFVADTLAELECIPAERRSQLGALALFVGERTRDGKPAALTFICTHNSRRSHMAQLWAQAAAHHFGINGVETYSGGTEATAFDPRAVAALERAGFAVEAASTCDNPVYAVRFSESAEPMECFSKVYDQPPNPTGGFCAVMTCGAADAGCPVVFGAAQRIAITYDDPKAADGTAEEAAVYDERCREIAREMLYAFSRV